MFGIKSHIFTALAGIPAGIIAGVTEQTSGGSSDLSWLAPFGAAAPFAGLALLQMNRAQNKLDKQEEKHAAVQAETEKTHRDEVLRMQEELRQLRQDGIQRERELVLRFGNIIYDSALLYKEGNAAVEQLARAARPTRVQAQEHDDQFQQVLTMLGELTESMNRGPHGSES